MTTLKLSPRLWLPITILAIGIFAGASVLNYPPPTCDETTYASAADSVLQRGTVALTIYPAGSIIQREVNAVQFGRSYAYGLAGLFALFGISLVTARAFSVLGWLAAGALVFILGRQAFNKFVGVAASLIFATTTRAFFSAHLARPETWAAAAILLAAWAAVKLVQQPSPRPGWAFAAGLLAVWPGDVHLIGFAFTFSLALAIGWELGLRQRRWRLVGMFGLGVLVAAGLWFWLRFGNGDWSYLDQLGGVSLSPLQTRGDTNRWLANLASLPSWFYTVFWTAGGPLSLAEGALGVLGIGWALRHAAAPPRLLAGVTLGALLPFGVATNVRWLEYGLLWSPFWIVLGVAALSPLAHWLALRLPKLMPELASTLVIAGLVAGNLAGDGWLVFRYRGSNFPEMESALRERIPAGSRVLADPVWWWALRPGRTFMSEDYLSLISLLHEPAVQQFLAIPAGASIPAALTALRVKLQPDYVIVDGAIGCLTGATPNWQAYQTDIEEACRLIGQVRGAWLDDPTRDGSQIGQIARVYQCSRP